MTVDLAGNSRFCSVVDLGAYEKGGASTVVSTTDDIVDASDGKISLREAIAYAGTNGLGSTITFAESLKGATIKLAGTQLEITKTLTIDASALYDATTNTSGITIDADGKSRVMNVAFADSDASKTLTLNGLTLMNGNADNGGGLYVSNGTVDATNVKISGNTVSDLGGGVYVDSSGKFNGTNVEISNNTAHDGGGVNSQYGNITLTNAKIANNTAINYAGGVRLYGGTINIFNSEISGNKAQNKAGGGVRAEYGVVTVTNTKIVGNTSEGGFGGGGVATYDGGTVNAINSEISGNKASNGGGVCVERGEFKATNVTIAGNEATNQGGGVYVNEDTTATLNNSIVANNVNGDVCNNGTSKAFNVLSSFVDWSNKSDQKYYEYKGGSLFVGSGDAPYSLSLDSEARNKGDDALAVDADGKTLTVDLAGKPRFWVVVDLGAYEANESSTIVTTTDDIVDASDGKVSLREAIAYAGTNGLGSTITFAESLKGATIKLAGTQLEIAKSLTIDASGITIDADGKSRVMSVAFADSDVAKTLTLNGLTFINGNADYGGGLRVDNGIVDATNVKISGNTASKFGGGVAVYGGKFNVINAEISGNKAESGAGVRVEGGEFKATNATIAGNDGGGVYVQCDKTATLKNSIVVNNSNGDDVFRAQEGMFGLHRGVIYGHNTLSTFKDWDDDNLPTSCYVYYNGDSLFVGTGDTPYSLTADSVARDKGDNALAVDADGKTLTVDLAGNSRVYNGTVDLGAYEKGEASTVVSTTDDIVDASDGKISLREAIAYAGTNGLGSTITFAESLKGATIKLAGTQLEITKTLTIDASALYDATTNTPGITIDADGKSRVMNVAFADSDASKTLTLNGLTLMNGNADNGGGLYLSNGTVDATNVKISGNTVSDLGGGVYVDSSGKFNGTNVEISNNTASDGGGVNSQYGNITLNNAKIADNTVSRYAGGVRLYGGTISIANSEISGNKARVGGGVRAEYGVVTVTNTKIVGNTAEGGFGGGGVATYDGGTVNAINSEISGNKASNGGGVCVERGEFKATNVTIAGNEATNQGGGVYVCGDTTATLNNSIVAKNTNGDVYNAGTIKAFNVLSSFVDWSNKSDQKYYEYKGGALFVGSGDAPYSLTVDSEATNKGDDALAVDADGKTLTVDLAGKPRFYGVVDLGAYEANETSTIVTTKDDVVDASDGKVSLREAIANAGTNGLGTTITFAESLKGVTIKLDGTQLEITKSLTIDASALYDATLNIPGITIDARGKSRVMNVAFADSDASKTLTLNGLTLVNGNADNGGGLYVSNGTVDATNVKISDDTATGLGGGVYVGSSGKFNGTNVEISNNTAHDGGGVNSQYGTITLNNAKIANNTAINYAGGVRLYGGTINIFNSEISGNKAQTKDGGGIRAEYGVVTVTNTKIVGNTAEGDSKGGGVATYDGGTINAINSEISGNKAFNGGGVYVGAGEFKATNVTIAGNEATNQGGGVYVNDSMTATLNNSIVAKNSNGDVYNAGTSKAFNVLSSFVDWSNKSDQKYYVYNGGSLFVETGDAPYKLTPDSQARDKGDDALAVDADGKTLTVDLAGKSRFYKTVDLGAYERGEESAVVTTRDDIVDASDGLVSLREAIAYAGTDGFGTTITFDASLKGATLKLGGTQLEITKTLTIDASKTPGITIDADGKSRVMNVEFADSDVLKTLTLYGLTLTGGNADNGGALRVSNGTVDATNVTISGNAATNAGGAVYVCNSGAFNATNVTISKNQAPQGGGVYLESGSLEATNVTITGNTAPNGGGGVHVNENTKATLKNSIVVLNFNGDVYNNGTANGFNVLSSFTNWNGGDNQITYDASKPLFEDATNGKYALAQNSQAFNKGNNAYVSGVTTDVTGYSRVAFNTVDLGAYEYHKALPGVKIEGEATVGETLSAVLLGGLAIAGIAVITWYAGPAAGGPAGGASAIGTGATLVVPASAVGSVISVVARGIGDYSDEKDDSEDNPTKARLDTPAITDGTAGAASITVSWTPVAHASSYKIYYRSTSTGVLWKSEIVDEPSYEVKGLTGNREYEFKVMALGDGKLYLDSASSATAAYTTKKTALTTVSVSGKAELEQTLTATAYVDKTQVTTATYQWFRVDASTKVETPITGATQATYKIQKEDVDFCLKVKATGTGDYEGTVASVQTEQILSLTNVSIEGKIEVGQKLTATAYANKTKITDVTYQWYRVDATTKKETKIDGATKAEYEIQKDDLGFILKAETVGTGKYKGTINGETARVVETVSTVVTTDEDKIDPYDGKISFREAVEKYSQPNDKESDVKVTEVTITFDKELKGKTITINGAVKFDGATPVVVKGEEITLDGGGTSQIISVATGARVTIVGLTLQKGLGKEGGALVNDGTLTLENATFKENSATNQGGAIANNGTLTLNDSKFEKNSATFPEYSNTNDGGAIVNYGTLKLTGSTFEKNTANDNGGAIANYKDLTVYNSTFNENTARLYGGAIYNAFEAKLNFDDTPVLSVFKKTSFETNSALIGGALANFGTTSVSMSGNVNFKKNTATFRGGACYSCGILAVYGEASFNGNKVQDDKAQDDDKLEGGAIYNDVYQEAKLNEGKPLVGEIEIKGKATFEDNEARDAGGAIATCSAAPVKDQDSESTVEQAYSTLIVEGETTFNGNKSKNGGAIYALNSKVELEGATISKNGASENGGAVYATGEKTSVTLDKTSINENEAKQGGAIYVADKATVVLKNLATISGNEAAVGGGVAVLGKSKLTMTSGEISGNTAVVSDEDSKDEADLWKGGGVYATDAEVTLINVAVVDNSAKNGGGVYMGADSTLTATHVTIAGNKAQLKNDEPQEEGETEQKKEGEGDSKSEESQCKGGGVYADDGSVITLNNSIVATNSKGGDVYKVKDDTKIDANQVLSSFVAWSNKNDAKFYEYKEGSLFSGAENAHYALTWDSVAKNKGDNALAVDAEGKQLEKDAADNPRIYDTTVDLGAYEKGEKDSTIVTIIDDVVNAYDNKISLREAIAYAGVDGNGTTITFDSSLKGKTIKLAGTQLEIAKAITIDASALYDAATRTPGITIDADQKSRVFYVHDAGTAEAPVTLIGLKITRGSIAPGLIDGVVDEITGSDLNKCGGGIYASKAFVTFKNGTISENTADEYGGGVYATDAASNVTLDAVQIANNTATNQNGGGICVTGGATVVAINGSTISGNKAVWGGGVAILSDGKFTLTTGKITGNVAKGKADAAQGKADAANDRRGGGVYAGKGEATLNNALVAQNEAVNGGGVYADEGATITATNATLAGNKGGGAYAGKNSTIALKNSIVATNKDGDDVSNLGTANAYYVLSSFSSWSGGEKQFAYDATKPLFKDEANGDYSLAANSQAFNRGNNAYVDKIATDLSGAPRICDTTVDLGAYEYHVDLPQIEIQGKVEFGSTLTAVFVGDSSGGTTATYQWFRVDVTTKAETTISGATGATYVVQKEDVGCCLKVKAFGTGAYIGTVESVETAPVVGYVEKASVVVTTNEDVINVYDGKISLREAIEYAGTNGLGTTITFDSSLNGKTIKLAGKQLEIRKSLNIDASALYDAATNTPGITIDANGKSRVLYIEISGSSDASITLNGLKITGGHCYGSGGGIHVTGGRSSIKELSFTNVTISDNSARDDGGGVYVSCITHRVNCVCDLTFTNATISNNTARDHGGGVCLYDVKNSSFLGGKISGNKAANGGGVDANLIENLSFSGGEISGNTATNRGGGISINTANTTSVSKTEIKNNTARKGGGVYISQSYVTFKSASISYNKAEIGGGIYAFAPTILWNHRILLEDSTKISGNQASEVGGGVYLERYYFYAGNTTFSDNKAPKGSAIYNADNPGETQENGPLYSQSNELSEESKTTLVQVSIVDNQGDEGAVYIESGGILTATNVTIAGNTASGKCGGIYAEDGAEITLENSIVAQNKLENDEGEIYADVYNEGTIDAYCVLSSFLDWSDGEGFFEYDPALPLFKDAENGDYSLTFDSQALDKGNEEYLEALAEEFGIVWQIAFGALDLGAYEFFNGLTSLAISGKVEIGQTLTAIPYADENKVTEATYQWYRDDEEIDGANDANYKVTFADFGHCLSVVAVGIGTEGYLGVVEAEAGVVSGTNLTIAPTLAEFTKALELVDDGGTISFAESSKARTITIRSTIDVDKTLTIDGSAANVTFNGAGKQIFNVDSTGALTIKGLTLSYGFAKYGGAIRNEGTLTVVDSTFKYNNATYEGGAIFNATGATMNVAGVLTANFNNARNGGAFANYGDLTFGENGGKYSATFKNNTAYRYGGAYFGNGTLTFKGASDSFATFSGNVAILEGGAIYNDRGAVAIGGTVDFESNRAPKGGAVANYGTFAFGENGEKYAANFKKNVAYQYGGAYYGCGTLTLTGDSDSSATFSDNTAGLEGGALYNGVDGDDAGKIAINAENVDFASNKASKGGAVANYADVAFGENGEKYAATFRNNTAYCFGGAYFGCGTLTFVGGSDSSASFTGNFAGSEGGAIYNAKVGANVGKITLDADSVDFRSNKAWKGAAVANYGLLKFDENSESWTTTRYYTDEALRRATSPQVAPTSALRAEALRSLFAEPNVFDVLEVDNFGSDSFAQDAGELDAVWLDPIENDVL